MDLQSILNKIITDTELYNKFVSLNSQEEIYKFLNDNGYSESYEFFCEQLDNVKNDFALESLDNSELDEVSGGANLKQAFKAGGAGLLASAMVFQGLSATATKLSDQCIDLASKISSRQNPNITIINNYDKGIVSKATTTIGAMLLIKHMLNNNIFKNITNLFGNKIGDEVLVGFISSYIDYVNTRLRLVCNAQKRSIDPDTVHQKLSDTIKFIEALAQKNGIDPASANLYQESLNKIKSATPFDYVDQEIQICINSVMNVNKELSNSIFEFGLNLINESEKNDYIQQDSKKLVEIFLKNPKTASEELTKLFNGNNDQSKKFESQDNQDYSYDKIHSNTLANFGECYKNCIITCYRGNIVSGNPINPLIGSIKDLADNYGVSNFTYYQEYLNKLVEMSKNNDYNIDDLIMNTKSCFAFIDNENIKSLETDIYEYGINLHQKLSDNVYRNEDIPAPFTDGMRDVARELKPLFENCYRAYWRYYNGRKDPNNTAKYSLNEALIALTDHSNFKKTVSTNYKKQLVNEYNTQILYNNNNDDNDTFCSILSDIWDNIRKLIQDNSDIENGSQISRKIRESIGFKYASQNVN